MHYGSRLGFQLLRALGFLLIAAALGSLWPAVVVVTAQVPVVGASALVRDTSGRLLATATLRESRDGVLISLNFADRSALTGAHAIQIHAVGRCDPPDFASAGGIFNPFGKQHGLRNPDGPMAGDVPSLTIGPNGLAIYNTAAVLVKLGPGPESLLRQGGTSLVIFDGPDDNQSQPEGNAGPRIACGVIVAGDVSPSSLAQTSPPPATNSDPDLQSALLIAALGILTIAAGVVLRVSPHHPDP
jgi:Cu-Zn family superoxide dismutase